MTVYIDIVLLENLSMNYLILFSTAYVLKIKRNHLRILISSLIGGVYSILAYTQILKAYTNIIMKIILSLAMVYIAFNPKNFKVFIKQALIFYLTSFLFGGTAFALLYFIKPQDVLIKNGVFIGTYPLKVAILGGILGFAIIVLAFKIVKYRLNKKDMFCNIEIFFKDNVVKANAMIDTGNFLKDPISHLPVIVVEKDILYEMIPYRILDNIEKILGGDENNIFYSEGYDVEYISKFRLIPFNSLGKQNGMLLGFKVDKVIIYTQTNEEEIKDVIIGIYNEKLSKNGKYNALLGLDIFERGKTYEYFESTSK